MLSRLSRARERLRARLTKRGITLSTAALTALVTGPAASASVPTVLAQATMQAAAAFVAGGSVAVPLLTLTEGVIHAMFAVKVKFAATVVLGVTLIVGAGTYGYGKLNANGAGSGEPAQADAKKSTQPARKEKDDPTDARVREDERRAIQASQPDVYREQWNARRKEMIEGKITVDVMTEANRFLGTAELALSHNLAERIAAIEAMIQRAKIVEKIVQERVDAGLSNKNELAIAKGDVAYAERVLAKKANRARKSWS